MKKVLIVEDHADIRRLIRMTLELDDHDVHEAADAATALAAAQRLQPDVVLLDVMLPGTDGLAVCRALRADPRTAAAAVVMVSALGGSQERAAGLAAGADAYLAKPFSPLHLIDTLETLAEAA